jgi:hypothetical protein
MKEVNAKNGERTVRRQQVAYVVQRGRSQSSISSARRATGVPDSTWRSACVIFSSLNRVSFIVVVVLRECDGEVSPIPN